MPTGFRFTEAPLAEIDCLYKIADAAPATTVGAFTLVYEYV